jgi:hypothetical protein
VLKKMIAAYQEKALLSALFFAGQEEIDEKDVVVGLGFICWCGEQQIPFGDDNQKARAGWFDWLSSPEFMEQ